MPRTYHFTLLFNKSRCLSITPGMGSVIVFKSFVSPPFASLHTVCEKTRQIKISTTETLRH